MDQLLLSVLALRLQVAQMQLSQIPRAEAAVVERHDYYEYASSTAVAYGIDPDVFTRTLQCESHWKADALGDHGTSYGIAQIHAPAHPEVTREQAYDGIWSINWAAHAFATGHAYWWSCYNTIFGDDFD